MKLTDIIFEQTQKPKAVIMAGGGGAGKSYILDKLGVSGVKVFNPDTYVEKDGLALAAASSMIDKEVQAAVAGKENFIWDTTAGNPDKIEQIINAGYDVAMVMVYTHPIISIISNFDRKERSLPISAVLSTWRNTYSLIERYKSMLGNNFYLVSNLRGDRYKAEVEAFNQAVKSGSKGIQQFIEVLKQQDPERYISTYSKPFEITDPKALQAYEDSIKGLSFDTEDKDMVKALKKHFMSFWERDKMPPAGSMEKKVAAVERDKIRSKEDAEQTGSDIARMLGDKSFADILSLSNSVEEVKPKIQAFFKN